MTVQRLSVPLYSCTNNIRKKIGAQIVIDDCSAYASPALFILCSLVPQIAIDDFSAYVSPALFLLCLHSGPAGNIRIPSFWGAVKPPCYVNFILRSIYGLYPRFSQLSKWKAAFEVRYVVRRRCFSKAMGSLAAKPISVGVPSLPCHPPLLCAISGNSDVTHSEVESGSRIQQ